jgi:tetratricopeptide (TPR) repeat protein
MRQTHDTATMPAHAAASAAAQTAHGWMLETCDPPRWDAARSAYQAALAVDRSQPWALVGLATCLSRLGDDGSGPALYAEAAAQAVLAVEADHEMIELLGWCQYRLGRFDDAAASFERALAIDPQWVSVLFDLGLVALSRADAAASAHYRAAVQALAGRAPADGVDALRVALEDLDDARLRDASLAASATASQVRAMLVRALRAGQA